MQDLEIIDKTVEILVPEAIPPTKARMDLAKDDLYAYVGKELKTAAKELKSGGYIDSEVDRLESEAIKDLAAKEYISLVKLQDYIDIRKAELRETFFKTLDETPFVPEDDTPVWQETAPVSQLPGEIEVPNEGIKFQRTAGAPLRQEINLKAFKTKHPRLYKSFIKERVIPAVEEQRVEFFDEEAFLKRAETDKAFKEFITTKYRSPQFRVYNIFD